MNYSDKIFLPEAWTLATLVTLDAALEPEEIEAYLASTDGISSDVQQALRTLIGVGLVEAQNNGHDPTRYFCSKRNEALIFLRREYTAILPAKLRG